MCARDIDTDPKSGIVEKAGAFCCLLSGCPFDECLRPTAAAAGSRGCSSRHNFSRRADSQCLNPRSGECARDTNAEGNQRLWSGCYGCDDEPRARIVSGTHYSGNGRASIPVHVTRRKNVRNDAGGRNRNDSSRAASAQSTARTGRREPIDGIVLAAPF